MARLLLPLVAALALSACIGKPDRGGDRPPGGRPGTPPIGSAPSPETRACFADLNAANVRFSPVPDQSMGGGCAIRGSVRLSDIGTPTTNLGPITCPLARGFSAWVRHAIRPAARQVYRQDVVRVETFGTYSCRNVYGAATGRLSQHAFANAIDVSAFVLADGRRISVLDGWNGDDRAKQFLRLVHTSACRRFTTVLSPDYNAAHANHFHFDMGGRPFCR